MLEHLLDSGARSSLVHRTGPVFLFSILLHTAALFAVLAVSYLSVGSIQRPDLQRALTRLLLPRPPAPPAAPLPKGVTTRPEDRERKAEPVKPSPDEMIQPEILPTQADMPALDEEFFENEFEDSVAEAGPFGVPWGHALGDPNGSPWGKPGGHGKGDPNGVVGGLGVGDGEPGPVPITGEISPPVRTFKVEPEYPAMAREARAEGKVILEIVVTRSGDVEAVRVLRSHPLFDGPAVEAIRQWKYRPALQSGRPVRVYMTVVVDFKLK
jgi:protein TonB